MKSPRPPFSPYTLGFENGGPQLDSGEAPASCPWEPVAPPGRRRPTSPSRDPSHLCFVFQPAHLNKVPSVSPINNPKCPIVVIQANTRALPSPYVIPFLELIKPSTL